MKPVPPQTRIRLPARGPKSTSARKSSHGSSSDSTRALARVVEPNRFQRVLGEERTIGAGSQRDGELLHLDPGLLERRRLGLADHLRCAGQLEAVAAQRDRAARPDADLDLAALAADDAGVAEVTGPAQLDDAAHSAAQREIEPAVGVDAAAGVLEVLDPIELAEPGQQHVEGVRAGVEEHPAGGGLAESGVGRDRPVVDAALPEIERLDRAQHAAAEHRGGQLERGILPADQPDADAAIVAARRLLQQRHVRHGRRQRLLDERVQPGGHRLDADAGVQVVRHGDERDVRVRSEVGARCGPGPGRRTDRPAARRGPRRDPSAR